MLPKIFLVSIFATIVFGKECYDDYSLYRIVPTNAGELKLLSELQENNPEYNFWTDPVPTAKFVNVMVAPENKAALQSYLDYHGIKNDITIENVQNAIDNQTSEKKNYARGNFRSMTWDTYYMLEEVENWMNDIVLSFPDLVIPLVGGVTYEGREIKGLKITHGITKNVIFIEAGIHSREWIVVSTACYIINELLTSTDPETMAAARDYEWYIFPVTNPDGYVWTHEQNRMWRKNRRPIGNQFGVDLNRNWNNNWLVVGASTDPASETYAGTGPFSEPETRSLSTFITTIENIQMYLSFHSYSQLLLLPFGNSTEPYANYNDAMNIGRRAMGALSVRYGTQYVTGNIAEAIYHAAGVSIDWVKEHLKVPLVYSYELRDRGQNGFLLPTEQILPNNLEVMDSLIELIRQGKRFGYLSGASITHISFTLIILLAAVAMVNNF